MTVALSIQTMLTELCASVASSSCKLAVGAWLQLVLLFLLPFGTCFLLLSKKASSVDQTLKSNLNFILGIDNIVPG